MLYHITLQAHILCLQPNHAFLGGQKLDHPYRADSLGNDCRQSSALYPHSKYKDKYRIQTDIDDCSDQNGKHGNPGFSLTTDKCIKPHSELDEYRSQQIDSNITFRILNRRLAGPECIQNRRLKYRKAYGQHHREYHQQSCRIAQYQFRPVIIVLSKLD